MELKEHNKDESMPLEEEDIQRPNSVKNLLLQVKTAQNQNGLKNNQDYGRYHSYCKAKVSRLRKKLRLTHENKTKKKAQRKEKKPSSEQIMKDVRFLMVNLFQIEADWAYAMQMKQVYIGATNKQQKESAQHLGKHGTLDSRNPQRLRVHSNKRFRKAFNLAKELLFLSKDSLDQISVFEVQAYVSQMQAYYLMETSTHDQAMDCLLEAKLIYEELKRLKDPDSLDAIVYNEKIDQINTFIRKTAMDLNIMSSSESIQHAQDKQMREAFTKAYSEQKDTMKHDLADDQFEPINLFGQTLQLKNEKMHGACKKIETNMEQIKKAKHDRVSGKVEEHDKLVVLYLTTTMLMEEAQAIIQREKNEEKKKSETVSSIYTTLPSLLADSKMRLVAERNCLQAEAMGEKFDVDKLFSSENQDQQSIRPQNIVRHYEKAMRSYQTIIKGHNEKQASQSTSENEDKFIFEYLNCLVSYFITLVYVSERKFTQAFLLSERAFKIFEKCQEFLDSKLGGQEYVNTNRPSIAEKLAHMVNLMERLEKVRVKCHAKTLLQKAEQHKSVLESLMVDTQMIDENLNHMKSENLYDMLFDSFGKPKRQENLEKKVLITNDSTPMSILDNEGKSIQFENLGHVAVDLSKIKVNKSFKIMNMVPRFQSVPATPQLFDLAGSGIIYPSLNQEVTEFGGQAQPTQQTEEEQKATGGLMSAIGSFFGRK